MGFSLTLSVQFPTQQCPPRSTCQEQADKRKVMLGIAGTITPSRGLGADGVPKPVRSSETCSPDGVGWELPLLSSLVLSVRGLTET